MKKLLHTGLHHWSENEEEQKETRTVRMNKASVYKEKRETRLESIKKTYRYTCSRECTTEIFILKIKHVKLFEAQQKRPIFKAHIPL